MNTAKRLIWPVALLTIITATMSSLPLRAAEEEKILEHEFTVTPATQVSIESGVGTILFIRCEGETLQVTVTATRDNDSFWQDGDLTDVELTGEQRGDTLSLVVSPQDNISLDWVITLPKVAALDVELGVGEIDGDVWTTNMSLELGVGDLDLNLFGGDIAQMSAEVGVGDAAIKGMRDNVHERTLMTASARASGTGQARITAEVGVGDVTLRVDQR